MCIHKCFQFWRILSKSTSAKFFLRLYAVTFLVVVPLFSIILLTNKFQTVNVIRTENGKRVAKAKAVLDDMKPIFDTTRNLLSGPYAKGGTLNNPNVNGFKNDHSCSIAISVITVSRDKDLADSDKPHYIIQSVAGFLKVFQQTVLDDIHLQFSICNVDINPVSHIDMQYIPKWVTVFQRNTKSRETYKSVFEKGREDYIFCLQKVLEQNTSYLLLVEDDALPHSELLTVIKEEFLTKEKCAVKQRNLQDAIYIKLHTNDADINFIRTWPISNYMIPIGIDLGTLSELIAVAMLCAGAVLLILKKYTKIGTCTFYTFVILFIYIVGVINFIGRQNIRIVWRYILGRTHELSSAPAGSFVAMLYPRDGAYASVRYLSSVECNKSYAKDLALNDLARTYRKQLLYIEPSLFTHIGYLSSQYYTEF